MDMQGKEQLLKTATYDVYEYDRCDGNKRSRRSYVIHLFLTLVCIAACIVACVCAGYCYATLNEIQKLKQNAIVDGPRTQSTFSAQTQAVDESNATESFDEYDEGYDTDYEDDEYLDYYDDDEDYETDDREIGNEDSENREEGGSGTLIESSGDGSDLRDHENNLRTKRAAGNEMKQCNDRCKSLKDEAEQNQCKTNCSGGQKPMINLPAAHFEALSEIEIQTLVGASYDAYSETKVCKYIGSLEGTLCLNRTFRTDNNGGPLKLFRQAKWVDESAPVTFENSVATVKSSGIVLVYAQAYIGSHESKKSIIIVHKRDGIKVTVFSCNNGVHPDHSTGQLQTCFVQGLLKVEKGDTIEIQASEFTREIECDSDKTFFGVVQLSGIPFEAQTNTDEKDNKDKKEDKKDKKEKKKGGKKRREKDNKDKKDKTKNQ